MSRFGSRHAPVAIVQLACLWAVSAHAQEASVQPLPRQELHTLAGVYGLMRDSFAQPVESSRLILAAIRGMVREIDPEGGEYMTEEQFQRWKAGPPPGTGSLGMELRHRGDSLVLGLIQGGPADQAGLRTGDLLLSVDGQSTAGLTPTQAVHLVQGPVGSKVRVKIRRLWPVGEFEVEVARAVVSAPRPRFSRPVADVLVLHVPAVQATTLRDVALGLERQWAAQPFKGLVLDLRGSQGGLLDGCIGLAAAFLPPEAVIVRSTGRKAEANRTFLADPKDYARQGNDPLAGLPAGVRQVPLMVLVDEATASGSEIIAAALKDHGRARLVGRPTFGRGSIQTVTPLGGSGALKYTSAYWQTPSGETIHQRGVQPALVIESRDAAMELEAAVTELARLTR